MLGSDPVGAVMVAAVPTHRVGGTGELYSSLVLSVFIDQKAVHTNLKNGFALML